MPDTTNPKPVKSSRRTWTPATLHVQLQQFVSDQGIPPTAALEEVFAAIEKAIVAEQTGGRR